MVEPKSYRNDRAKERWRKRALDFVVSSLSDAERRNGRVLSLVGPEMVSVFDLWDKAGFKRRNITGVERDSRPIGRDNTEPGAYERLVILNNELKARGENSIVVPEKPWDIMEYIRDKAVGPYSAVELDYTASFDQNKIDAIGYLALRGLLAPKAVLITNFLGRRETRKAQENFVRGHVWAQYLVDNHEDIMRGDMLAKLGELAVSKSSILGHPDQEEYDLLDLEKARDAAPRMVVLSKMTDGTGVWNTRFYETMLDAVYAPKEGDGEHDMRAAALHMRKFVNMNRDGYYREVLHELVNRTAKNQTLLKDYFIHKEARMWDITGIDSSRYVSESGSPMISDMFVLEERVVRAPLKLQGMWQYLATKEGLGFKQIVHDKVRRKFLGSVPTGDQYYLSPKLGDDEKERNVFFSWWIPEHEALAARPAHAVELIAATERFDINDELDREDRATREAAKLALEQQRLAEHASHASSRVSKRSTRITLRDDIFAQLAAGTSDDEIKAAYHLEKMELAGYKASYTRSHGALRPAPSSRDRVERASHSESFKTMISADDVRVVEDYLSAMPELKAPELVPLFVDDGGVPKYTWQAIAAYIGLRKRHQGIAPTARRGKVGIDDADLDVIVDLISNGPTANGAGQVFSKDIARQFSRDGKPKYSWQQIAGVMASQTKALEVRARSVEYDLMVPAILDRDGHVCGHCHISEAENQAKRHEGLHVHYIDHNHAHVQPQNLISLCTACYVRTNMVQTADALEASCRAYIKSRYSS